MIRIMQFHVRRFDAISGTLRSSSPIELPLHVYLSKINMTAFIREVRPVPGGQIYMFQGMVVYGRHPVAKIESSSSGFVASEVVPFITVEEKVDVKTR